jgi:hypothetical protein
MRREAEPDSREQEARALERQGNAHLANGLVLKARRAFRTADAVRRERA